jgi:UDP-N-acetylmuramoyl-tripeptide--D-alanyl-D-alanine ligase
MTQPVFKAIELEEWTGGKWMGNLPERIEGVSHDTRQLKQNNIFFALKGERFDGHNFVVEAFERGASAAVILRSKLDNITERPVLCVDDTHKALIDSAKGYRKQLHATAIGITGSVGKTTVKEMMGRVLSLSGQTTIAEKSWNNAIGVPLTVMNILPESKFAVFELGTNHPGEIRELCEIAKPDCGIITSIGLAHIGNFGSLEAIAKEKGVLFECLPSHGIGVININNPFFEYFRSITRARIITVSDRRPADFELVEWDASRGIATIRETAIGQTVNLKLSVSGRHNAVNVLHVSAMARALGVPWEQISCAISGYRGIGGRLEKVEVAGICIIDDTYNANPASMRAGIECLLEEAVEGKRWMVLGGMLELGEWEENEHRELGRWIALKFTEEVGDKRRGTLGGLVVVGNHGRLIAEGAIGGGLPEEKIFICSDVHEVSELLLKRAGKGDCILFKASRRIRLEKAIEHFIKRKEGT